MEKRNRTETTSQARPDELTEIIRAGARRLISSQTPDWTIAPSFPQQTYKGERKMVRPFLYLPPVNDNAEMVLAH